MSGDGLTKKMATYVAKERVGPGWEFVTSAFEAEDRINVYFKRNGTLVGNPRNL